MMKNKSDLFHNLPYQATIDLQTIATGRPSIKSQRSTKKVSRTAWKKATQPDQEQLNQNNNSVSKDQSYHTQGNQQVQLRQPFVYENIFNAPHYQDKMMPFHTFAAQRVQQHNKSLPAKYKQNMSADPEHITEFQIQDNHQVIQPSQAQPIQPVFTSNAIMKKPSKKGQEQPQRKIKQINLPKDKNYQLDVKETQKPPPVLNQNTLVQSIGFTNYEMINPDIQSLKSSTSQKIEVKRQPIINVGKSNSHSVVKPVQLRPQALQFNASFQSVRTSPQEILVRKPMDINNDLVQIKKVYENELNNMNQKLLDAKQNQKDQQIDFINRLSEKEKQIEQLKIDKEASKEYSRTNQILQLDNQSVFSVKSVNSQERKWQNVIPPKQKIMLKPNDDTYQYRSQVKQKLEQRFIPPETTNSILLQKQSEQSFKPIQAIHSNNDSKAQIYSSNYVLNPKSINNPNHYRTVKIFEQQKLIKAYDQEINEVFTDQYQRSLNENLIRVSQKRFQDQEEIIKYLANTYVVDHKNIKCSPNKSGHRLSMDENDQLLIEYSYCTICKQFVTLQMADKHIETCSIKDEQARKKKKNPDLDLVGLFFSCSNPHLNIQTERQARPIELQYSDLNQELEKIKYLVDIEQKKQKDYSENFHKVREYCQYAQVILSEIIGNTSKESRAFKLAEDLKKVFQLIDGTQISNTKQILFILQKACMLADEKYNLMNKFKN